MKRPGALRESEAQALEHVRALRLRDRHADDLARALDAQRHRLALGQRERLIVHRAGLAAAHCQDQLRDALDVLDGERRVDAALEAMAGIGARS